MEDEVYQLREEKQKNLRALAQFSSLRTKAQQVDELIETNETLQQALTRAKGEISKLKAAESKWIEEIDSLKDEVSDLNEQIESLTTSKTLSESQLNRQISQLKVQLETVSETDVTNQEAQINRERDLDTLMESGDMNRIRVHVAFLEQDNQRLNEKQTEDSNKIHGLETALADAHTSRDTALSECTRLRESLANLTEKAKNLEASVSQYSRQSIDWESDRTIKDQELEKLKEEVAKLRKELANVQEMHIESEGKWSVESSQFTDRVKQLEKDLSWEKRRVEELLQEKSARQQAEQEITSSGVDLTTILAASKSLVERLQSEVARLTEDRDNARAKTSAERAKFEQEILELTSKLQQAELAREEAKSDLAALQSSAGESYNLEELAKARADRDEMERKLREAEKGLQEWKQRQAQTIKNRETKRIANADISGLQMMTEQIDMLKQRITELEIDNDSLRKNQSRKDGGLAETIHLREMLEKVETNLSNLQAKYIELEAVNQQLKRQQTGTQSQSTHQIDSLNQRIVTLEDQCLTTQQELQQCQHKLEAANARITQLLADAEAISQGDGDNRFMSECNIAREECEQAKLTLLEAQQEAARKQKAIDRLLNAVDGLKGENQRLCDSVVAQFEAHRHLSAAITLTSPSLRVP
eukprot:c5448_g1_i1.p1 GENE.c5448_g1_i1~~c5448_g1_i1.p1  ORF type:complete len:656 (+),score=206.14 c5448_g1_i1:25-1968(+)